MACVVDETTKVVLLPDPRVEEGAGMSRVRLDPEGRAQDRQEVRASRVHEVAVMADRNQPAVLGIAGQGLRPAPT